ncbi:hypothetical protein IC229_05550 [Spirosoma sp. BT702]|uniref:Uncharacterized protein n=1 Tax=Spirosoma profusum TaxID=2771354 RepID=A0A926XUQ3_9BACT|nr:hypothetical protein [Spirosoma profusum]MBD2700090.1 hypothetical protein [Spirosoma profusum]
MNGQQAAIYVANRLACKGKLSNDAGWVAGLRYGFIGTGAVQFARF